MSSDYRHNCDHDCSYICHGATVGVRELKNQLSSFLDRVKAGEVITVTEHGRPIARLTAIGGDVDRMAELVEAGVVRPAERGGRRLPARRVKLADGTSQIKELVDSSDYLCAEIGYVEARAAPAAAHRNARLSARSLKTAKEELEGLWAQVDVVAVSAQLVRAAGELAERERLRGYDAVHLAAALAASATVLASADDRLIAAARHSGLASSNPLQPT